MGLRVMNILLVDLWNVFHIEWHNGTNKDARYPFHSTLGRIRAIARQYDYTAIMTDGGKSFRADLDPRWKANRAEKEAGLIPQLTEVERQLDAEGFCVFKSEGFEADDLIATAVFQLTSGAAEQPRADMAITINSGDRDLLALLEPGVSMLKTTAPYPVVHAEDVRGLKNIGVDPPKIRDFLLLCDKHNGVKYFDGIGPVHAARLLNQFGTFAGVIAALDWHVPDTTEFEVGPPSIRAAIKKALAETIDGRQLIDVAMQVVTLRTDAPIDIKKIFEKKAPKTTTESEWEDADGTDAPADARRQETSGACENDPTVRRVAPMDKEPVGFRAGEVIGAGNLPEARATRQTSDVLAGKVIDGQDASPDGMGQTVRERPVAAREPERQPAVVAQPVGRDEGPRPMPGHGSTTPTVPQSGAATSQGMMLVAPRWELALEPPSIQDAWRLAQQAAACNFWPKHGGPPGCMMIIMAGRSRNLTAFDALNGMHIIEGKPCYGAYLLIGMVQAHPSVEYFELAESDEKHALWIAKRKKSKREQRRLYTIDQAKAAGLVRETFNGKPSNWQKNPEDMLIKTAGAKLTRGPFAYITSGAVAAEEMGYE